MIGVVNMTSKLSDYWLWVGAGVFFLFAVGGIRYAMSDIIDLIELEPEERAFSQPDAVERPENSIKADTLRTLYHHPSPSISRSAACLIVKRFMALPNAAEMIRKDLHSNDQAVCRQAQQAIRFLADHDEYFETDIYAAPNGNDEAPSNTRQTTRNDQRTRDEQVFRTVGRGGIVSDLDSTIENLPPGTASFAGWDQIPIPRGSAAGTEEESERRRRRREAIVYHEGSGMLDEEDIIRPLR